MARSTWKGPFSSVPLQVKKSTQKEKEKKQIWSRTSMILPIYIGKEFLVHKGKGWVSVKIVEEMIGHKFGEFSSTRNKPSKEARVKKEGQNSLLNKQSSRRK